MTAVYRFGQFELRPAQRQLLAGNEEVRLGARAFDVLHALVVSHERVVLKDELISIAWPGLVVEENNLQVQISTLRKVLGAGAIVTIAGLGYRFALEVGGAGAEIPLAGSKQASNLPQQITSFVGRKREHDVVTQLLAEHRLVTMTGIGGVGKTRLSLQVAGDLEESFADGACLVELGRVNDPALVPVTVAQMLGVVDPPDDNLTSAICAYLKTRRLLLILDNCEHLIEACAVLSIAVLESAPQVRILATSREPMQIPGEQIVALQPLSLPTSPDDPHDLARADAIQLFIERVRLKQPGFVPSDADNRTVAAICFRLDGIPLALELAAARALTLSISEINARLIDQFKLLTEGSRGSPSRHQTLRATFDWSHAMLTELERVALRRLAIFPGEFSLMSAVSIVADGADDEESIVESVSQLATRSLIAANMGNAVTRYRLLETTRVYAGGKLEEAGETLEVSAAHARHCCDILRQASDDWLRLPDAEWDARYVPQRPDARAALSWAFGANGDTKVGIELAGTAGVLLLGSGDRHWLENAAASLNSEVPIASEAHLWLWLGVALSTRPAKGVAAFQRAIVLYRYLNDPVGLGHALARLGGRLAFMGEYELAELVFQESLPAIQQVDLPKVHAGYYEAVGFLKSLVGDVPVARLNYENALVFYRRAGAYKRAISVHSLLAECMWLLGDLEGALSGYRDVVDQCRNSRFAGAIGFYLMYIAGVQVERGEFDDALRAAREGLPLIQSEGDAWLCLDHLASHAAQTGRVEAAARIAGYADKASAVNQVSRQPNEARARDRVQKLLSKALAADELERLFVEGSNMTEGEVCRLALDEGMA